MGENLSFLLVAERAVAAAVADTSALYSNADPAVEPLLWSRFYESVSAEI
jgi:hypothetical protein